MRRPVVPALAALALFLACGDRAVADPIEVWDPWVRTIVAPLAEVEPGAPRNSAAYMVLRNPAARPDALVDAATDVAEQAVLHDVVGAGDGSRMRPVVSIEIPAGGQALLRPGGPHVMLTGLRRPVAEGDTVRLVLRFASGAILEIMAPVRPSAAD